MSSAGKEASLGKGRINIMYLTLNSALLIGLSFYDYET